MARRRKWRLAPTVWLTLLAIGLGVAPAASAGAGAPPTCGRGQTIAHLDTKTCPPTPHAPAVVVKRACCRNKSGAVHCRSFPQCPKRSPS